MARSAYRLALQAFTNLKGRAVNSNMYWLTLIRLFLRICLVCHKEILHQTSTRKRNICKSWTGFDNFRNTFEGLGDSTAPFLTYKAVKCFSYANIKNNLPEVETIRLFNLFLSEFMRVERQTISELIGKFKLKCCSLMHHSVNCEKKWASLSESLSVKICIVFFGDYTADDEHASSQQETRSNEVQSDVIEFESVFDYQLLEDFYFEKTNADDLDPDFMLAGDYSTGETSVTSHTQPDSSDPNH